MNKLLFYIYKYEKDDREEWKSESLFSFQQNSPKLKRDPKSVKAI